MFRNMVSVSIVLGVALGLSACPAETPSSSPSPAASSASASPTASGAASLSLTREQYISLLECAVTKTEGQPAQPTYQQSIETAKKLPDSQFEKTAANGGFKTLVEAMAALGCKL
jgi:hypothetical protein